MERTCLLLGHLDEMLRSDHHGHALVKEVLELAAVEE